MTISNFCWIEKLKVLSWNRNKITLFFLVYSNNWSRDDAMMPFKVNTTHKKFSTVTCNFFNWILKRKIKSGNFFRCSAMKQHLSWVYTSGFCMRLPHCVVIFNNLPWFCSIKVSNKKLQRNAENACGNRMCKRAFSLNAQTNICRTSERNLAWGSPINDVTL